MCTLALFILFCLNNNSLPILYDNNVMGTILTFIGTGLAIDSLLITLVCKIFSRFINPEKNRSRKELKRLIKSELRINHTTLLGDAWGEYDPVYQLHLKKNVIISKNTHKTMNRLKLENSYLLVGEAGSGKSTYLRKLFYSKNKKWNILFNFLKSRIVLYFDARILLSGNRANEIATLILSAKYRNVYIICDGLDELGEQENTILDAIDMIYKLHQAQYNGRMNLIISGRTEAIQKYQHSTKFVKLFSNQYFVSKWPDEDIYFLVRQIGKVLTGNKAAFDELLSDKEKFSKLVIKNPMRCKMLCIVAYHSENQVVTAKNQYELYFQFFTKLFTHEIQRMQPLINYEEAIENILKKIGQLAFYQYRTANSEICQINFDYENVLNSWDIRDQQLVFLIWNKEKKEFLHHTYSEFFIAYYYVEIIKGYDLRDIANAIEVLSCLYNNIHADLITQGFFLDEDSKKRIIKWLVYIYSFTLPKELSQELRAMKEYGLLRILPDNTFLKKNLRYVSNLSQKQYLCVKYEIAFRIGRFQTKYALPFLEFVYFQDSMALYGKNQFSSYELAILKRQCAVSASFLCGIDIELDYVNKMLPGASVYNQDYDLVNRSHTLIYYGDVLHTDLFSFIDDGKSVWDRARKKRIGRLRELPKKYDLHDKVSCFRLFDLATIYTFLISRNGNSILTEEEQQAIERTVIKGIQDMPKEREKLMLKLQREILQLPKTQ